MIVGKYVVLKGSNNPILLPRSAGHDLFSKDQVESAGFFSSMENEFGETVFKTWGSSLTLGIQSQEEDVILLKAAFNEY